MGTLGVLRRTAKLFNNEAFSDVKFHVKGSDGQLRKFFGHRLILAMAGDRFARDFYSTNWDSTKSVMNVNEFYSHTFELMLRYVYTEKIKFPCLEDAMCVFQIAMHYEIQDLIHECNLYLSQYTVNKDSVFARYDCALAFKNRSLLDQCRGLVSAETQAVFRSPYFCYASFDVMVDILKLNKFSVTGELEIIEAALKWAKADCRHKNLDPFYPLYIRNSFLPLCEHLRFLTLDIHEFLAFAERNIFFTESEIESLTAKMLCKEDTRLRIPQEFSIKQMKRYFTYASDASSTGSVPKFGPKNWTNSVMNDNQYETPSSSNQALGYATQTNNRIEEGDGDHDSSKLFNYVAQSNSRKSVFNQSRSPVDPSPIHNIRQVNIDANHSLSSSKHSISPGTLTPPTKQRAVSPTRPRQPNTVQSPNQICKPLFEVVARASNTPVQEVMSHHMFRLHKQEKQIGACGLNDVKCYTNIRMKKGALLIHEIELRVQDRERDGEEEIQIHGCLHNGARNFFDKSAQLKNGVLRVALDQPVKVMPGDPLDIEIMIETLKLSRCSISYTNESKYKLNPAVNVEAEVELRSNQPNGPDSFFFLVSKIFFNAVSC